MPEKDASQEKMKKKIMLIKKKKGRMKFNFQILNKNFVIMTLQLHNACKEQKLFSPQITSKILFTLSLMSVVLSVFSSAFL